VPSLVPSLVVVMVAWAEVYQNQVCQIRQLQSAAADSAADDSVADDSVADDSVAAVDVNYDVLNPR
jgi:hypothetical protein